MKNGAAAKADLRRNCFARRAPLRAVVSPRAATQRATALRTVARTKLNPRAPPRGNNEGNAVVLNPPNATSPAPQVDLAEGENLRHRCRNPQCRAKLPASVANAREAFCCCGCHGSFFRVRCRVCEQPIEQPAHGGVRFTCNKAKCKRAWRAGFGFGHYHTFNHANSIQERPVNTGSKVGISRDRAS
jgi:hypothetical protein